MFGHIYAFFWILVVILGIGIAVWGYFRWDRRYRGAAGPAEHFQATGETFRDPTTQRMMRVYSNAANGERQYREEPPTSG
jgi:hypothetical protein